MTLRDKVVGAFASIAIPIFCVLLVVYRKVKARGWLA